MEKYIEGIFVLEDGTVFRGKSSGAVKTSVGEAAINTSMIGYQEVLSDPSYHSKIVAMTTVEVGNYGINNEDFESDGAKLSGLLVRSLSKIASNWRSSMTIEEYLVKSGIPCLSGIDTRALVKKLRTCGSMKACISTEGISVDEAIEKARAWSGLDGVDCAKVLSTKSAYHFDTSKYDIKPFTVVGTTFRNTKQRIPLLKCACIDFGLRLGTLKNLAFNGFDITVFPANVTAAEISKFAPDCVFLSSGAGDASALTYAHKTVAELIKNYPILAIDFGCLVLAHALGAKTYKLKMAHSGPNQSVKNLVTGLSFITSQNHSYAVDAKSLEDVGATVTEVNMNDATVEGFTHKNYKIMSVQYEPTSEVGPNGSNNLFTEFYFYVKQHLSPVK